MAPFTNWDDVPLVVNKSTTARVLGTSVSSINRALKAGTMLPAPMPRLAAGKWQWSKQVLRSYVDGGYQSMRIRSKTRKAA